MNTTGSLIAIALLLFANGFFVAAEFALVKARGFRIELMAAEGSRTAQLTMHLQSKLEEYLAACQLGITMASLGLGWVGEPAVAALLEPLFHMLGVPDNLLHTTAFAIGFLIFSSLHIVVGEQVPKTFAIRKAEPVSLWIAYPLHFSYLAAWPLIWLLNKASSSLLSLVGVQEVRHTDVLSGEEIKGLVATSTEHGEIHEDKAGMLRNLFEFDQRHVGRVMVPRNMIRYIDLNALPSENLALIKDTRHSRFPILDSANDESIVGILLVRDIYHAILSGEEEPWHDLKKYSREPLIVPESQRVSQLFELMRKNRAHMALVVDEYGAFVGLITLEDLLEEIVGEIEDETDDELPVFLVNKIAENQWEADGFVTLSDLEKAVGLAIPAHVDANTISGLFMERLARMPVPGDIIQEEVYSLHALSIEDQRVGRVLIELTSSDINEKNNTDDEPES
jgi:CBS domain containing-hemolysin-like protein